MPSHLPSVVLNSALGYSSFSLLSSSGFYFDYGENSLFCYLFQNYTEDFTLPCSCLFLHLYPQYLFCLCFHFPILCLPYAGHTYYFTAGNYNRNQTPLASRNLLFYKKVLELFMPLHA